MRTPVPCPICGKAAAVQYRPFCSQGCRDRDLLRWLGEGYRLPGSPLEDGLAPGSNRLDSADSDD